MAKRKQRRAARAGAHPRLLRSRGQRAHPARVAERRRRSRSCASRPAAARPRAEDAWQRRSELLFERLAVRWEIAGLPLTDQAMLLGRYRMADEATRRWVRRTIAEHVERHIPELGVMHARSSPSGWLAGARAEIAEHAERELEALVAVSSPSGDVRGRRGDVRRGLGAAAAGRADRAPAVLDAGSRARPARDARRDRQRPSVLLLGHLDTVHGHADHRPLERAASGWWARARST